MARISVGIPFLNARRTLIDAIRSVFAQSLTDWELILVDDGSTDGSEELARRIRDDRVSCLGGDGRRGLPARLNEIGRAARGELVARMDADDLMHPERLSRQLEYMERHPDVDVVGTAAWLIDQQGDVYGTRDVPARASTYRSVLKGGVVIHPSIVARREWILKNTYDERFGCTEDWELWCRVWKSSKIRNLSDRLFFYRETGVGFARKYRDRWKQGRTILLKYGPGGTNWLNTVGAIGSMGAKGIIYSLADSCGMMDPLMRMRASGLAAAERTAARETLDRIRTTCVPGLEEEGPRG